MTAAALQQTAPKTAPRFPSAIRSQIFQKQPLLCEHTIRDQQTEIVELFSRIVVRRKLWEKFGTQRTENIRAGGRDWAVGTDWAGHFTT